MRYRIFCCTGSRDSHTCVANNTNHSRNICGKFKNRRKRESFSFQRRAEIKRSILARTRLKPFPFFLPKSDTFPYRVIIAISKTGESKWRNLVNLGWLWQCNFRMFFNCCYFSVRVRQKNFLSLGLFLFSSFPDEDSSRTGWEKWKKRVQIIA